MLDCTCSAASSETATAWWVVQEAARQLVAARLRTPLGTPAELFAALERGLQQTLTASSDLHRAEGGALDLYSSHQRAWLLLGFMAALERNVQSAAEGSVERTAQSQPVIAFFAANRKVHVCLHLGAYVHKSSAVNLPTYSWNFHPASRMFAKIVGYLRRQQQPSSVYIVKSCIRVRLSSQGLCALKNKSNEIGKTCMRHYTLFCRVNKL